MFTRHAWHAGRSLNLPAVARTILVYLTDRAHADGTWTDSQAEIAAFVGVTDRAFRTHILTLVNLGLVEVVAKGHRLGDRATATTYRVMLSQPERRSQKGRSNRNDVPTNGIPNRNDVPPNRNDVPAKGGESGNDVPPSDPRTYGSTYTDPPEGDARPPARDDEQGRGGADRASAIDTGGGAQSSAPLVQSPLRSLHTCAGCGRQWPIRYGNTCQRCHLQVGDQPPPPRDPNADPF